MFKQPSIFYIQATLLAICLYACSNSNGIDYTGRENTAENWISDEEASTPSSKKDYLPIDDTEYPYAGIPRLVIETENFRQILDRETEIPAKLQIWGEKTPESEIMDLTIRGRGNTSWGMPKKSYKIEFIKKQSMLGMPHDRDWALISNYADKTLMKNFLAYHLSASLNANYTPRCSFVELFLNNKYLGVYLLTETVKISNERVNIPKNDDSFLVEFDKKIRDNEQKLTSNILSTDSIGKIFRVHSPKNASQQALHTIETHIYDFEMYLKGLQDNNNHNIENWIDLNEYIKFYWVQEFSKNPDACFYTSVYFTWQKNSTIKMGPVWDFDIAFGGHNDTNIIDPKGWFIKKCYWNRFVYKDSIATNTRLKFWTSNRLLFAHTPNIIDSVYETLKFAGKNNFKRWNILESTAYTFHQKSFTSYSDAVQDLKNWVIQRLEWIQSDNDLQHSN